MSTRLATPIIKAHLSGDKVPPLRVTHVIGNLAAGGAEHSLCALATCFDRSLVESKVLTLTPGGRLAEKFSQHRIPVETVAGRGLLQGPRTLARLTKAIRDQQPEIVVAWMYHANLLAGLAARLAGSIPVVWNIRHTWLAPRRSKLQTRLIARVGGLASRRLADHVVYVAHASRAAHAALGYRQDNSLVIPNGFDTTAFRPRPDARPALCRELGISPRAPLIGVIGRFHADKDQRSFLLVAQQILRVRPETRFVLCGEGVDANNRRLAGWIEKLGLGSVTRLLGHRDDVARVAAALDIVVSSSLTEAFPRAVGEAMACGVPCVVTDVGDSKLIVGATGRVAPPGDTAALAARCLELLALPPDELRRLGAAARRRVLENYHLDVVAAAHFNLWRHLARGSRSVDFSPMRARIAA